MTACSVGELAISIEEKKIAKGIRPSNQVFATSDNQCSAQIGRPLGPELQGRPRRRVAECQNRRVKGLPRRRALEILGVAPKRASDSAAAAAGVDRIADNRMSDVLQMHANLMRAPTVQIETKKIRDGESSDDARVRPGLASRCDHRHALAILRVTGNRRVDHDTTLVEMTPGERRISPMNPPSRDRGPESAVSQVRLGDDHEAGRIPIETVDDSGSALGTSGQGRAPRDERVDQRVVPMSGRWMYHEAGGLVDDRYVLILEEDLERNRGGSESAGRLGIGKGDDDSVSAGEKSGGASRRAVYGNRAARDQAGRLGAGESQLIGEKAIEPLGRRD